MKEPALQLWTWLNTIWHIFLFLLSTAVLAVAAFFTSELFTDLRRYSVELIWIFIYFCLFPDVMASNLPRFQVSKCLWKSGQPGAQLRRYPHHQERPWQPLLCCQLQVRGSRHWERWRRFFHCHTCIPGNLLCYGLVNCLLVYFGFAPKHENNYDWGQYLNLMLIKKHSLGTGYFPEKRQQKTERHKFLLIWLKPKTCQWKHIKCSGGGVVSPAIWHSLVQTPCSMWRTKRSPGRCLTPHWKLHLCCRTCRRWRVKLCQQCADATVN